MYNPRKTGNNNTKQKIRNTYPPLRSEKPPKLPTPFRFSSHIRLFYFRSTVTTS